MAIYSIFINPFTKITSLKKKRLILIIDLKQRQRAANIFHVLWPLLEAGLSVSTFGFLFTYARKFSFLIYMLLIIC